MESVQNLVCQFLDTQAEEQITVGVVADILLDEYYEVSVDRINPEYPVPVMRSVGREPTLVSPGGGALTAWALTPFNTRATLFGCADERTKNELTRFSFDLAIENHRHPTPLKRRFYDKDFALSRWDVEEAVDPNNHEWTTARERLLIRLDRYIEKYDPDIVILSDYGKGLFQNNFAQEIIEMCQNLDIPTLVDPKSEPIMQWHGCTIFKPNKSEADSFIHHHHDELIRLLECEAVVVTDGGHGVWTHPRKERNSYYSMEKPVSGHPMGYSGGGDVFAAVYAIAYAHNFNVKESSIIAYNAAAVYVQTRFNNPITPHQLRKHVDPIGAKIFANADNLSPVLSHTKTIAFCNGAFDLLGSHHLKTLKFAKNSADILIVGVNTDESVKRLKGDARPIIPLNQRIDLLASLEFVDFVIPFDEDTPLNLINRLKPTYVIKGSDYKAEDVVCGDCKVLLAPLIEGNSTSKTIEQIKSTNA